MRWCESCPRRDARCHDRDLLRQDRHADSQRDDGAGDPDGRRHPRGGGRQRLRPWEGGFTAGEKPLAEAPREREAVERILRAAALANDAALVESDGRWLVQGDPTEGALVVAARKLGLSEVDLARWPRLAEIPFTSERKRHATAHLDPENPGEVQVFVKGAPEIVLGRCRHLLEDGRAVPLDDARRADLARRNEALADQALRTLAVASRAVPAAALGLGGPAAGDATRAPDVELPEGVEDNLVLLHAAVASSLLAHVLVVHVPVLQAAFRTVPLSLGDWLIAAGVSATLLLATEIAKAVSRADGRQAGSAADVSRGRPPAPA